MDYKDRLKIEYIELKVRYEELHRFIIKYDAGKLEFTPNCSISLLREQEAIMGQYLYTLEVRAMIEEVDLYA